MTDIILDNISLILLLPLWIFLIIICGRFFAVYVNKKIIYTLTLVSSLLGFITCSAALTKITNSVNCLFQFIHLNNFRISIGLQVDRLSLITAAVLFGVSFVVQLYSISYMKEDKKSYRFFALLNLFNFLMACLLFSPNLFQMYVFWELVGVISYLLIGYEYKNIFKSEAARRVFITNRIGDTALIAGIILTSYYMTSYAENLSFTQLAFEDMNVISVLLSAYTSSFVYNFICGLFIVGAIVKSAQFPFHTWLQDAMEAKLPVSALLHSSTMVVAGIYLILKIIPLLSLVPEVLTFIMLIGIITAIVCSILASMEIHPKKILAYSTSANLGLVLFAIGLSNIRAALVFLIAHAIIKSGLFLVLPKDNNKLSRLKFYLLIIFALSLSGILFSGLAGKELIYPTVEFSVLYKVLYLTVAYFSAFYLTRLVLSVYKSSELSSKFEKTELFSVFILMAVNVMFYIPFRGLYNLSDPYIISVGGICTAALLYKKNLLFCINKCPPVIENFYNKILVSVYEKICNVCNATEQKIFYNYAPIIKLSKFCVKLSHFIEEYIMNGTVNRITSFIQYISKGDKILQTGNVQSYNTYALIIITILIVLVIIGYKLLLM